MKDCDYQEYFETIYSVCQNTINSVGDYTDKASKVYKEIVKDLSNKGFAQNDIDKLCNPKEVSRIMCEVDEMAEAGYKIDKQSEALFKFYKSVCNKVSGKEVNLTDLSTKEINAITDCSKLLSKAGGVALLMNTFNTSAKAIKYISEGEEDKAGKELWNYGWGLIGGAAGGVLAELAENSVASNGFQAIGYYDENRDGVINSNDAIYSELKIWQDKNQNGTVDAGEFTTLDQAGIESINVAYENICETDESGNSHSQKGSYTRTDGTIGEIEDVWFAKDAADTILSAENNEQYYIEETDEIRNLPDIQGKVLIFLMIKLY